MNAATQKIVRINQPVQQKTLTKSQKLFNNLIQKIAAQKKAVQAWQDFIPEYNSIIAGEFDGLRDSYNEKRVELARLLDKAYQQIQLKNQDKQKISYIIREITANLIVEHDRTDLKDLHDKHSDVDFDEMQQEADKMAGDYLKAVAQDMYGMDIDVDADASTPEKLQELLEKLHQQEQQRYADNPKKARQPKNPRQTYHLEKR